MEMETSDVRVNPVRGEATFLVEVAVPLDQAGEVAELLDGSDHDILLQAEGAMRQALGRRLEPEIEIGLLPKQNISDGLRDAQRLALEMEGGG